MEYLKRGFVSEEVDRIAASPFLLKVTGQIPCRCTTRPCKDHQGQVSTP